MLKHLWTRVSAPAGPSSHRFRPGVEQLEVRCLLSGDVVLRWNAVALDALKNDYALGHTPDQGGPTRDSRALAIVHAAIFDAANSIDGRYTAYLTVAPNAKGASLDAAVAQAAHDTLAQLYPSQTAMFDGALADTLAHVPNGKAEDKGIAVGKYVAAAILTARANDGSDGMMDYHPIGKPGHHQPDPLHPDQGFLTPDWGKVTPFAIPDVAQYVSIPPPALTSAEYTAAFDEVKALGAVDAETSDRNGDGQPDRTAEQTRIGIFWGYDGSPGLGTPPREYNQIVRIVAQQQHNSVFDNARLFALVNIAMADGGIQCWDTKYIYDFWRPVIAIRAANTDGNPDTVREADWAPLGAPRSDDPAGTNFTPPFPAYTSGHATFGAAMFRTLARFYGRDDITFSFTSDEFNGVTKDQDGSVRPVVTRTYHSFSQAAEENGQSRIYLGIHWRFDKVEGIKAGNAIADFAFAHLLRPLHQATVAHSLTAASVAAEPVRQTLRADQVQPLLAEALARWQATGVDTSALHGIDVRIADLGGLTLGQAAGGVIWLDDNAAGWGWFVDATPWEDSEFTTPGDQGEGGRMDLLTVLEHEIGHLLGRDHEADGVMQETLDAGIRRTVGPTLAQDTDGLGDAQTLFAWNADTPWIEHGFVSRHGKRR
jgi:hypothetical protein